MKYNTGSWLGKWEACGTFDEARKICDRKNKRQKHKWLVFALETEEAQNAFETQHSISGKDFILVYDPFNVCPIHNGKKLET